MYMLTIGGAVSMTKPRKLKAYDQQLDDKLDLKHLAATAGDSYNIYAMNPDTSIPDCPLCKKRMKNHGKYERQYLDVVMNEDGTPHYITLHYLFYKYRCMDEKCNRTLYQKPIDFARDNANVTKRLEDVIVRYASAFSYAQTERKIKYTVTKQAVGQIAKRWVDEKDEERGGIFYTPKILGLVSFFWDNREYIIAVDAGDTELHIIDVLKTVDTTEITIFLNHMDKNSIECVVTDCNDIIVNAVVDQLPNAEILVDTDALLQVALDGFWEIIMTDAKHTMTDDKKRLMKEPSELKEYEDGLIRRITENKPRVSSGYDHINMLRSILSRKWDISDIRDWEYKIPIDCKDEFLLASEYIDAYWNELLNFYKRRREVTPELYEKLKKLDKKVKEFKNCSDELFRAKMLYVCKIGKSIKNTDGKWHGVPYKEVMDTLDSLLNETED